MTSMKNGTSVKLVKNLALINPWIEFLIDFTLKIINEFEIEVNNCKEILRSLLESVRSL